MISLANDLLDFAQLKNGKFRKQEKWMDVRTVVEEIINIQNYKAAKKSITINTNFDDCRDIIFSDEQRILQIVLNLLSNSLKFTDELGVITISCKTDREFVEISVEDTGIGISEQD
jgi:signal transduction histidine kinase